MLGNASTATDTSPLSQQGSFDEAEVLYDRARDIREKFLGSEHPKVAQSLENKADLMDRKVISLVETGEPV